MNCKNNFWKFLTGLVVIIILLNPETIQLALFIDAVGLDLFLLLLEVQVVVIGIAVFNSAIKPLINSLSLFYRRAFFAIKWKRVQRKVQSVAIATPVEMLLMNTLVIITVIGNLSLG